MLFMKPFMYCPISIGCFERITTNQKDLGLSTALLKIIRSDQLLKRLKRIEKPTRDAPIILIDQEITENFRKMIDQKSSF